MVDYYSKQCDPDMVEELVKATLKGLELGVIPDVTTDSEIISAIFTLLDRTLRAMRKIQTPQERFQNAAQINKVLREMLTDHGSVPH